MACLSCTRCFYCSQSLSSRHEHDHFPIPASKGGTETVPTCINCHDLKDRIRLRDWNAELAFMGMVELCAGLTSLPDPEDVAGAVAALGNVTDRWSSLSPAARLM